MNPRTARPNPKQNSHPFEFRYTDAHVCKTTHARQFPSDARGLALELWRSKVCPLWSVGGAVSHYSAALAARSAQSPNCGVRLLSIDAPLRPAGLPKLTPTPTVRGIHHLYCVLLIYEKSLPSTYAIEAAKTLDLYNLVSPRARRTTTMEIIAWSQHGWLVRSLLRAVLA